MNDLCRRHAHVLRGLGHCAAFGFVTKMALLIGAGV